MSALIGSHRTARGRADGSEVVPLSERAAYLQAVRAGFAVVVMATALFVPSLADTSRVTLALVTVAYVAAAALPQVLRRLGKEGVLPLVQGMLLLDGIYLVYAMYATGGTESPLRLLVYVHLVAVTLLASYRTGLKIALWHTLLYLLLFEGEATGVLQPPGGLVAARELTNAQFIGEIVLRVAGFWLVALATAAFSALNERELRSQKVNLEQLSAMVVEADESDDAPAIAATLLDKLRETFGFTRGAVLASPDGDLQLQGSMGEIGVGAMQAGLDPLVEQAWTTREPVLVREIDDATDPRLARLLPGARNVLVVPLFLDHGFRLGVLLLEHPSSDRIRAWVVAMIRQFASHAALALHNTWLMERIQDNLTEIGSLKDELVKQNLSLELTVAEQTQELRSAVAELREIDEQRRGLLSHLVIAQEEERRRIAGDIHDEPVQKMVTVSMRLQLLRKTLSDPGDLETVDKLLGSVRSAIRSMRDLLFELRPPILEEAGLAAGIRHYLIDRQPDFSFEVHDHLEDEPADEIRIVLYRIAQEALANAIKHAEASTVDVELLERDGGYLVRVQDNGVGFEPRAGLVSAPGHLGMSTMRERAESAGGWCKISSLPGGGATVMAWLPGPGVSRAAEPGSQAAPTPTDSGTSVERRAS